MDKRGMEVAISYNAKGRDRCVIWEARQHAKFGRWGDDQGRARNRGTRSGLGGSAVVVGDEEGRGVRALVLEEVVVPCEGAAAALDGAGEGAVVRVDGTGVALQSSQRRD